jgi:hypothetical protein
MDTRLRQGFGAASRQTRIFCSAQTLTGIKTIFFFQKCLYLPVFGYIGLPQRKLVPEYFFSKTA